MSGVEEGAALAALASSAGEAGAGAAAAGGTAAAAGETAAGLGAADAAGMGAAGLGAGLGATGAMDMAGAAGTGLLGDAGLGGAAMDTGVGALGTGAMDMGGMSGTGIPGSTPPSFMSALGDKIGTGMKTLGRAQQINGLLNPGRVGTAQPSAMPQQQTAPMPPPMRVQPPGAPGSQQGISPTPSQLAILKRMGLLGGMNG